MSETKLSIQGILLLDKMQGISSNLALQKVKRLLGVKKAGHTGNLDPLATGMLPLCLNEATKVCHYLLHAEKCYTATALLGITTNTSDATGEVIATSGEFTITKPQLLAALEQFKGATQQIPSMFSAIKFQGRPLYKYARKGIDIDRQAREIHINQLELTAFDGKKFSITVQCSKGTYIRNLVEDIGNALGVGAHLTALHRVYTAGFEGLPMHSFDALLAMSPSQRLDAVIPMDTVVSYLPCIALEDHEILAIRQGRILNGKEYVGPCVRLYHANGEFLGLGEQQETGELKAKRLLAFE